MCAALFLLPRRSRCLLFSRGSGLVAMVCPTSSPGYYVPKTIKPALSYPGSRLLSSPRCQKRANCSAKTQPVLVGRLTYTCGHEDTRPSVRIQNKDPCHSLLAFGLESRLVLPCHDATPYGTSKATLPSSKLSNTASLSEWKHCLSRCYDQVSVPNASWGIPASPKSPIAIYESLSRASF